MGKLWGAHIYAQAQGLGIGHCLISGGLAQVVFDEAGDRKIIFSSFDPDCATLVRLKQPRYPVFFLTCAGAKVHS